MFCCVLVYEEDGRFDSLERETSANFVGLWLLLTTGIPYEVLRLRKLPLLAMRAIARMKAIKITTVTVKCSQSLSRAEFSIAKWIMSCVRRKC